jgi:glycosyltransferase involved in cell wall biosynthesis
MRVGINASFLRKPATGIGQVTRHFLEELSKIVDDPLQSQGEGVEFFVYLEEDMPKDMHVSEKFTVRSFAPFLWKRDDLIRKILWEKHMLSRQARKDGCDVLLSLYQSATVTPAGMTHIMVVHDIIPRLFPEYLNNMRKKIYQSLIEKAIASADKIVAISTRTEKDLIAHLGILSNKISVSSIDVDPLFKKPVSIGNAHEVLKKYRLHRGYIYAGGGLEKRKNIEGLLRAYKALVIENKRKGFIYDVPKLVISGKLAPELAPLIVDVEKLVKELNLSMRVKILGFVPQEDLPALYNQALFFVFPSLYEGFGLPILEAMSQGVPVLSSQVASLPEVGRDAVMYCNPANIEDMTRAMKKMLLDKEVRAMLSVRGKDRSADFSWRLFVQKMLRIL